MGGAFGLVVGIALLLGAARAGVLDGDSTPAPVSNRASPASAATGASPASADASPIRATPIGTVSIITPFPAAAASPNPAATPPGLTATGAATPDVAPFLTPISTSSSLAPLRPYRVPETAQPATVVEILDGDEIAVQLGDKVETVRLISVDAPEESACFGAEATARTAGKIPVGTVVWLEADVTDQDSSGQLLRYVWFVREANGRTYMLNERLLAEGYAVISSAPTDATYEERFQRAQALAQDEGRGLWSACNGAGTPSAPSTPAP